VTTIESGVTAVELPSSTEELRPAADRPEANSSSDEDEAAGVAEGVGQTANDEAAEMTAAPESIEPESTTEEQTGENAEAGDDVSTMVDRAEPEEPPAPEPPPLCRIGVTEAGAYAPVAEGGVLPLIGGVQANLILMLGIEVRQALELSTVRIEMWIESEFGLGREYYTLGGPSPSCLEVEGETRCQLASLAMLTSPLAEDPFDLELLPVEVRATLMHHGAILCEPTLRAHLQRAR